MAAKDGPENGEVVAPSVNSSNSRGFVAMIARTHDGFERGVALCRALALMSLVLAVMAVAAGLVLVSP